MVICIFEFLIFRPKITFDFEENGMILLKIGDILTKKKAIEKLQGCIFHLTIFLLPYFIATMNVL